jgi:LAO/AO transport system kinase
VVLVPGQGDDIQAIKAGILEIGDVFLVNKADREGADRLVAELSMMLDLSDAHGWRPPIVKTTATGTWASRMPWPPWSRTGIPR